MKASTPFIAKTVGPDLMLYDPGLDEVHILNPAAAMIMRLCNEGKTINEIQNELKARFAVGNTDDLIEDIRRCMQDLRAKGLTAAAE